MKIVRAWHIISVSGWLFPHWDNDIIVRDQSLWLLRDFNGCKVVTEVILVERKNTQMNPEPGSGAVSRVTLLHPRHGLETQAADWSDSANQRVVSGYIDQSENWGGSVISWHSEPNKTNTSLLTLALNWLTGTFRPNRGSLALFTTNQNPRFSHPSHLQTYSSNSWWD